MLHIDEREIPSPSLPNQFVANIDQFYITWAEAWFKQGIALPGLG